jgi:hypothetical protein
MKLAKLPDRTPVRITFVASPNLAKSLALYAQYYEEIYRQAESISELMPYALEAFLESDRGFLKFRREREVGVTINTDQASMTGHRRSPPSSESSSTSG